MTGKRKDRLILAAVLLVALGGVVLLARYQSRVPQLGGPLPSSYFTGRGGMKALYQLYQALGWKTTRLRVRLSHGEALGGTGVLFLIQPVRPVTEHEAQVLRGWVEAGGVLVLGFGSERFPFFPPARWREERKEQATERGRGSERASLFSREHLIEEFGLTFASGGGTAPAGPDHASGGSAQATGSGDESPRELPAAAGPEAWRGPASEEALVEVEPGNPYTTDVSRVAVTGDLRLDPKRPVRNWAGEGATTLVRDREGIIAGAFPWGAGVLVVLTDSSPLTNAGLSRADNALFAVRLLEGARAEGSRAATVAFDEYHQGFTNPAGGAFAFLSFCRTPAGWAVIQALVVLAGWLYLSGRRWGRPVVQERAERRSELEFVEAVAEASRGAKGAGLALRTLRRRFQQKLAERLGLGVSGEVTTAGLEATLRQRDPELAGRVREVLLESAEIGIRVRTSDAALVRVARQFDDLEKEMAGGDRRGPRRGPAHPG
jgi:hypothetical protein